MGIRHWPLVVTLFSLFTLALSVAALPRHHSVQTSTWSIAALDPATGDVGVAAATCLPQMYVDGIAAIVPGKGVAAIQALWELENQKRVFALLKEGAAAEEIVRQVTDPRFDSDFERRQYGIVTSGEGGVRTATFSGAGTLPWAGATVDRDMAVTVQGNILVGEEVVDDALRAFKATDGSGMNRLWDRLMRALEAGSLAGGDTRCNNARVTQTAASAFILVARGTDSAYAAADLGVTDAGTSAAPWLSLSVTEPRFGRNPVPRLRVQYDAWRNTAE